MARKRINELHPPVLKYKGSAREVINNNACQTGFINEDSINSTFNINNTVFHVKSYFCKNSPLVELLFLAASEIFSAKSFSSHDKAFEMMYNNYEGKQPY